MPRLTLDLAASSSRVIPRWARWPRTFAAMAAVIVAGSDMEYSLVISYYNALHYWCNLLGDS
ncbi:hypothetical protein GCM10010116_09030 [Microbispora rosea subsp. aerata]|nr:hypothetical protein GCM10010116_09030 [Microbispora rosea subsp. aerata]GIH56319.1 hypothetical protein Mro02_32330 [Microbispora rosea subsp. aerata]GLJ82240.1 hypothetical protein GCM10017588_09650 [Microbispora rosea subsp. aerata]